MEKKKIRPVTKAACSNEWRKDNEYQEPQYWNPTLVNMLLLHFNVNYIHSPCLGTQIAEAKENVEGGNRPAAAAADTATCHQKGSFRKGQSGNLNCTPVKLNMISEHFCCETLQLRTNPALIDASAEIRVGGINIANTKSSRHKAMVSDEQQLRWN